MSFRAAASEGYPRLLRVQRPPAAIPRRALAERLRHARRRLPIVAECAAAEARQPALDAVGLPGRADAGPGLGRGGVPRRSAVAGLAERRGRREPAGGPRVSCEPAPLGAVRAGLGLRARAARTAVLLAGPHRRLSPRRRRRRLLAPRLGLPRLPFVPLPAEAPRLLGARRRGTCGRGLGPARRRAVRDAPRSSRGACSRRA